MELKFFDKFAKKKAQTSSFFKIRPMADVLFHADKRTDITKLIRTFRNFVNAPKKYEPTKDVV